jgi:hypothetical protein
VPGVYSVTAYSGTNDREVVFNVPPPAGARILITVTTQAGYQLAGTTLQVVGAVNLNDLFAVTTFNDTSQQDPLTLVFNGPVVTGVEEVDPFDPLPSLSLLLVLELELGFFPVPSPSPAALVFLALLFVFELVFVSTCLLLLLLDPEFLFVVVVLFWLALFSMAPSI